MGTNIENDIENGIENKVDSHLLTVEENAAILYLNNLIQSIKGGSVLEIDIKDAKSAIDFAQELVEIDFMAVDSGQLKDEFVKDLYKLIENAYGKNMKPYLIANWVYDTADAWVDEFDG